MHPTYVTHSPQATIQLGIHLGQRLKPGDSVFLFGDLGSGKTHFTKGIAQGLGVELTIKSPTFAYVNSYTIKTGTLYHYDLYRLNPGDDPTGLGLWETLADPNAINVVEWSDRLTTFPDRYVLAEFTVQGNYHAISIGFVDAAQAPENLIDAFYDEWVTPKHVREHCAVVANVARQVADAYVRRGEIVNYDLLLTACKLHDLARLCDFGELNREHFSEEITDEKWQKWLDLRAKFKGQSHSDIASDFLKSKGYAATAELVRLHQSTALIEEFHSFDSLEKKLVYYADKRVKHTEIVSLTERFRDGRERHGKNNSEDVKKLYELIEKETHNLEIDLFRDLDIAPSDVR